MAVVLTILLPFVVSAQTGSQTCLSSGYTIETINGIFTDEAHAGDNKVALQKYFPKTYHGEPLTIDYLLNKTHGKVLDITDTAIQKTFEGVDMWDPDFLKMLTDASAQVKTQKVLLVAHSQGNFYANNFYKAVTDDGDVSKKSIGVYSVATPASYVAGDGHHLTSDTDKVIAFLVKKALPGSIAPTNDTIDYKWSDDPIGHDFTKVYLEYRSQKIVDDIKWSLDKLSSDPTRSENTPCINPPKELSTFVKIVSPVVYTTKTAFVAVAAAATTVKNTAVGVAVDTYHLAVGATKWAYNTGETILAGVDNLTNPNYVLKKILPSSILYTYALTADNSPSTNNSAAVILVTKQNESISPISENIIPGTITNPSVTFPSNEGLSLSAGIAPAPLIIVPTPKITSTQLALSGSQNITFSGFGGGAPAPHSPQIVEEIKDDIITTNTATTDETKNATVSEEKVETSIPEVEVATSTETFLASSINPLSPSNTILSSTTVIFSGTYINNATFDTLFFELKNKSLDTATSSISFSIATTTGTDLVYSKEIEIQNEGDWQYQVRLEDSVNATSTSWSPFVFFSLATTTTPAVQDDIFNSEEPSTTILSSDLNANGIADREEADVVATSTKSLASGEYHFHNLTIPSKAILFLGGDNSTSTSSAFLGVKIVADNLTVSPGAIISADGRGYDIRGASPGSPSVNDSFSGANYGGIGLIGMQTATAYGSATHPVDMGSASRSCCTTNGGGGGAIRLSVNGSLVNDGVISANGNRSGSGGSVYVTTTNLSGGGIFSANAVGALSTSVQYHSGAGGRVAVYYQSSSFSGKVEALGGCTSFDSWSMSCADLGTAALFDMTTRDFYVSSSWRFQKKDEPFNFNRIIISSGSFVTMDDNVTITANELILRDSSSLTLSKGSMITIPNIVVNKSTLTFSGEEKIVVDSLTLEGNSLITVIPKHTLSLAMRNLMVGVGSKISADSKGYGQGEGPGAPTPFSHAGASYGGVGSWNYATSTYGSLREPENMGSGGYGYNPIGGGAIRLSLSDTFTNNGVITADGGRNASGGSIFVTTNILAGEGSFHTNGGATYCPDACYGSGGGGRVAIYYQSSSFHGTALSLGQHIYSVSQDGTVVFEKVTAISPPAPILESTSTPALSSAKEITSFSFTLATSTTSGVIDEVAHTINLVVPFGTDISALSPVVTTSSFATVNPTSGTIKDFTTPITYMVTAEDGSIQEYLVTIAIAPDTTPPTITEYTFNGLADNINVDFATATSSVNVVLTANEKVDWVSVKIENQNTPDDYKIFYSGSGCLDGGLVCEKSWNGTLSHGATSTPDGNYRVKVHIKDLAGNEYQDYLSPYSITVNTATP